MSASAQTPGSSQPNVPPGVGPGGQAGAGGGIGKRSRRETVRTAALVILAILITLFAVFNLNQVKVSYVFGSGRAPLIIVIVISVLVGILLCYGAQRLPRRKQQAARK
ncbi:MAG TPA: hypothetical protein VHW67_05510 [Solirubrobacteraceae bacterium]|jgi:uncharacterized integral membrane protein|nr:hypothetical protein [Solirubrobacteraceae bacterium]